MGEMFLFLKNRYKGNEGVLKNVLAFSSLLFIGLIFYGNTLTKPFLCDDYAVMYRLITQKDLFAIGFFRPLSDLSLYITYKLVGLNTLVYNTFNFLVHVSCSFVLYRITLTFVSECRSMTSYLPFVAALLFLLYPFHVEAVVWVVGRGALISGFCAIMALYQVLKPNNGGKHYIIPCLFYFVGLFAYESILLLPFIILVLLYRRKKNLKAYLPLIIAFSITLAIHFILRYILSGVISGDYGQNLFNSSSKEYLVKLAKVVGRSILPPSDNSLLLIILFVSVLLIYCTTIFYLRNSKDCPSRLWQLIIALGLSFIIPGMFGISTHTFEGGRLLYFPAFFLILSYTYIVSFIKRKNIQLFILVGTTIYFSFFLNKNTASWVQAGNITTYLLKETEKIKMLDGEIGLLNIPQEYNGALIFRNGFREALWMNGIDTSHIQILRTLTTEESRQVKGILNHKYDSRRIFVPPNTTIEYDSTITVIQPVTGEKVYYQTKQFEHLYYWNKDELIHLK